MKVILEIQLERYLHFGHFLWQAIVEVLQRSIRALVGAGPGRDERRNRWMLLKDPSGEMLRDESRDC